MEKQKLSYPTGVLILGILSVLSSCCYGIGLLFSIIALVLFSIDAKKYRMNPDLYSDYSTLNVGRILAIIGLVLSVLFLAFIVWFIMKIGLENLQDQEAVQQAIEEMFGVKQ